MKSDLPATATARFCGSAAVPLKRAAERLGEQWGELEKQAARRFPVRFPEYYLSLAQPSPDDPIRAIAWPRAEELEHDPHGIADPVGEQDRLVDPIVVQKHADRVILLLTSRCHFYCRFCFRAGHRKDPSLEQLDAAIGRLATQRALREVILSGGDPLVLPDQFLGEVLDRLHRLPSLRRIRVHSRAPVHDPARITSSLADVLARRGPCTPWLVLHAAHPRELTAQFDVAVTRLRDAGLSVLNQSVMLHGVNADADTLAGLFDGLYERHVKPYYLHHPDRVPGTARFRVRIEEGRAIYRELSARVSGPALPRYVIDLPDGTGKVDVMQLKRVSAREYRFQHPDGSTSTYTDIP